MIESELFSLVILPLLIFIARVIDVSMATIRTIFVVRGIKFLAAFIGFFEILIWLLAIGQIMANLTDPVNYIAYAGGFATGSYVGIILEDRLAIGDLLIRVMTTDKADEMSNELHKKGYKVIKTPATTNGDKIELIHIRIQRKELMKIIKTIKNHDPNAVYTVHDIREASDETSLQIEQKRYHRRIFDYIRRGK
ncbi:DUF2179 domain-containing protein [Methanonatronarchaeum sp. AMET-Sl]|uniref:DUF2179 domain-containing protein n=1 Tax=Methanonatronarchaeum sp. AMET-Sl TaxID=3037654 RepID=UPI00244DF1DA|nr:DUF2179 domain-containing protein [Methanonatronarchaeum sp. AMET-Sl]WGI17542.1 DUF2179 domain-containing protein [Methanonatronarchaeum sp. AMET-Sl]